MLILFDISDSQVMKDYKQLKKRTSGGFIRATKGTKEKDKQFITHWENTKKEGLPRGAYHFWIPKDDPKKQAKLFFDTVKATGNLGELPPALDIEPKGKDLKDVDDPNDKARICAQEIERLFGRPPLIYTSKSKFDRLKGDKTWASKYHLWVSHYITWGPIGDNWDKALLKWQKDLIDKRVMPNRGRRPYVSSAWDEWQIWQFTDDGRGPDWGTNWIQSKQIDLNVFRGTLQELLALGGTRLEQPDVTVDTPADVKLPQVSESVLDKIKQAGITPTIQVDINMADFNMKAFKRLKSKLEKEGITPEVHINIQVGSNGAAPGGSDRFQGLDSGEDEATITEPEPENSFMVKVKVKPKDGKNTRLQSFKDWNNNDLPIMEPHVPKVKRANGSQLRVSRTHTESDRDKGDGVIHGPSNRLYYKVTDDPANGKAAGLYVKKVDVVPV